MTGICVADSPTGMVVAAIAFLLAAGLLVSRLVVLRTGAADRAPTIWPVLGLTLFGGCAVAASTLTCIEL